MKKLITSLLILFSLTTWGQKKEIRPTDHFLVTGLVKTDTTFILKDVEKLPVKDIPDLEITNHKGEAHGSLKKMKGVLLKDLLKDIELKEDNLKLLSEFYFTFTASDNYKVVYSWNEIFNSPTGDNLYIVTSIEDEPLEKMRSRILIITPTDHKTGRRYIKGLSKIVVARTE